MLITSNGSWFLKDTEVKPLYISNSFMMCVGVIEHDGHLEIDEELCHLDELVIDGLAASSLYDEEIDYIIEAYESIKENESECIDYLKRKYDIE